MRPGLFLGIVVLTVAYILHSPARSCAGQSSSEDSLDSDALASETPPQAPSPKSGRDTEVSSRQDPDQGGHIPGAEHAGMDTAPGTSRVPGSSEQPPPMVGGLPTPPASSVQAELPGGLSTALKNASIVDEHRALMGEVVERIQSAESGLNASCLSLIKAFEVCLLGNP